MAEESNQGIPEGPDEETENKEPGREHIYVERELRVPTFTMGYEHTHKFCEIFYLKTGACTYRVNGGNFHLTAGDFCIVPAGDQHSTRYEGKENCERYIIFCRREDFPKGFMEKHPEIKKMLSRAGTVILEPAIRMAINSLFDAMLRESSFSREYMDEFLMLDTMQMLLILRRSGICNYKQISAKDEFGVDVQEALRYIALNYMQPLTLDMVAAQCNLSATYFSRKFHLVTGLTFKEYMNQIRLKQATQKLLTTDDSITKIADDCGFNGSNYFKDVFRKTMGLSPRDYRKQSKVSPVALYNPDKVLMPGYSGDTFPESD